MAQKEDWNRKINSTNGVEDPHQLVQQIAKLREANEETIRLKNVEKFSAIGRMARSLAHEIRNPLTNISLALEQLNAELPQSDDANLLVEMISRNTMRINHLISELIESTKFAQLNFTQESLHDLLTKVIDGVQHFAKHKNAAVEIEFANDLGKMMIDKEKLKIAFENLITHAIESVQPNEGIIVISTTKENEKCVITIQDNGMAVSSEKLERIFEPHFTSKQNSGMALTLAQNIILNHGGNIYVESEPGKGTTFTVILAFA